MKLNKKREAEILKAYNAYWESYLKSDMRTFASLLDSNCKIIGSSEFDVFDDKKSAVAFYSATENLVNGKAEFRNRKIQLIPVDDDVMVQEFCDFYYFENGEWNFYSSGRLSTLLHKKEDGWKIIYQHGSLPQAKVLEGKPAATEKIKLENKALREAVKLSNVELQHKNKELDIEASLERVRARTMSMQNSEELAELVATVFTELNRLDFALTSCIIWINHAESLTAEMWVSSTEMNKPPEPYFIKPFRHPYFKSVINAWKEKNKKWVYEMQQGEKEVFQKQFFKEIGNIPALMKNALEAPRHVVYSASFYKFGALEIIGTEKITDEKFEILHRLGKVFDMSYTRFNDLTQAEALAREALIEAALERVRSRTMGMHHSDELKQVINVVTEQFQHLGFKLDTANFITNYSETDGDWWISTPGVPTPARVHCKATDILFFRNLAKAIREKKSFFTELYSSKEKNEFFDYAFEYTNLKNIPEERKKYIYASDGIASSSVLSNNVILSVANYNLIPYSDEENSVIKRIGSVFEQSYTRFLDLQKAEAQAREALIEAALERVRSRTLAMQKSNELAETAAVLFRQLINLGIEPKRLYIGIVKDNEGHIEFWVTDEDGAKVTTQFISDVRQNASMKKMYVAWKEEKKSITIDIQGKELKDYLHYLADELKIPFKDGLSQKRRIQSLAIFGKGFIGMASPDEQPAETINLLERFAAVFNLTYTRFNDLKVAEAHAIQTEEDLIKLQTEKKRAEDALIDLRAAQKQLVQAEKMASLGQLTAGIAHEIQNPLNFVNNFSEVSNELMDEMKVELSKGNYEDVNAIADDVKQNLTKINYHGKRADAIVKGMLQHSRTSSGTKEQADINLLVEEYISLCFHGLRAKDPSFNATIKTDFDPAIEKVKIIPQDIGRVVLNMLTNAFFAVNEKRKLKANSYEPTVSISTKKIDNHISININDNGNGIPQNIIDKIFQPFFTTKPTGQGTGLGLSLSYDIIKAHGGEIKVETKEGKGTGFIIQLPVS